MYWKAIYEDGTEFPQFDRYGNENKYPKIDRKRLSKFVMMKAVDKPLLVIHLDKHKRLICRQRVEKSGMSNEILEQIWIVGWQETRDGVNHQAVFCIFEDGHIEARDRFKEDDPWFYSPKWSLEDRLDGINGGEKDGDIS